MTYTRRTWTIVNNLIDSKKVTNKGKNLVTKNGKTKTKPLKKQGVFIDVLADCGKEERAGEMGTACLCLWLCLRACLCIFVCICICLCLVHWCAGADCVGEEWVCEVDSASSAPHSRILHKHQTMRKHFPSYQYRHHHWPCTSLIVVQNTISHDTSPCSFSHQSARSLSQVGGLMLPYANIVPGVPKKVVNRILRALLVGQVFRPKWPKITLSCPNGPR